MWTSEGRRRAHAQGSLSRWGQLLEAGVEISEYQPTMYHCKVMIVDGAWVSVGSTNFDNRSFRLNDGANLNVVDRDFARQLTATFEADKGEVAPDRARRVARRPWSGRALERILSIFRSQM